MITIDLISGFPKAGKTTWIEYLAKEVYAGERICILGNLPGNPRQVSDIFMSKNIRQQILSLNPDAIFVEKNMSGWASVPQPNIRSSFIAPHADKLPSRAGTDWATFPYIS